MFIESVLSWEFVEYSGTIIVIVACWGEYEADFGKIVSKCEHIKERLAKLSTIILIAGLAIELLGLFKTSQQSSKVIEDLRTSNLKLEARVIELKAQQQPRRITTEQRARFIELAKGIHDKIPVKVITGMSDNETENFARELAEMIGSAGFGTNQDVVRLPTLIIKQATEKYYDKPYQALAIFCNTNGGFPGVELLPMNETNAPMRFIFTHSTDGTWLMLKSTLEEIGIRMGDMNGNGIIQPGEVGIFVPQKLY
jgi:hypothetical protein